MRSDITFLTLVCFVGLSTVSFAQQDTTVSLPYVAEITGDNVYIRSGAGTNYYDCGKLNKGDRVKVVSHKFSWSRIVPPPGSFSWISKQFVSIDPNKPTVGIVTGDAVRVWIGSENYKPIHSSTSEIKLDKAEKVKLLGAEQDNYYKIASPAGEYRWVSTEFTRPLGPDEKLLPVTKAESGTEIVAAHKPAVAKKFLTADSTLKGYYTLTEAVNAERDKPFDQQNYAGFKKNLSAIAESKEAGKAARYAQFTLKQIERFELALEVDKAVKLQGLQLQKVQDRINKAHAARLAQVEDLGRFTVVGKLKISTVYAAEPAKKRYQIIDDSGKILCLALPIGSAMQLNLSELIEQKVGLFGTVQPHPQTKGALLLFSEITLLN